MNVVILDTGCANLNSVKSAIGRHGYEPVVSRDPKWYCVPINCFFPASAPPRRRWISCATGS